MIPEITITISIHPDKALRSATSAGAGTESVTLSVPAEEAPYTTYEDVAVPPVPEAEQEEPSGPDIAPPALEQEAWLEPGPAVPPPDPDEALFGEEGDDAAVPPVPEDDPALAKRAGAKRSAKSKKSTR